MSRQRAAGWLAWLLLGWAAASVALAADDADQARIAAGRAAAEQRFAATQVDCQQRFAVNACLEAGRSERRQALAELRREANLLDDARRRDKAAQRLQAIRQRAAEPAAPRRQALPAAAARGAVVPQLPPQPPASRAAPAEASTAERDRLRLAQHQRRLAAARQHELELQQRLAEQDARHKPAAGLPVPGASAVPH